MLECAAHAILGHFWQGKLCQLFGSRTTNGQACSLINAGALPRYHSTNSCMNLAILVSLYRRYMGTAARACYHMANSLLNGGVIDFQTATLVTIF